MSPKHLLLLCLCVKVASYCIRETEKVSCFREFVYDEYYANAKTLFLQDSFINKITLRERFPSVNVVYVTGLYASETCFELNYSVEIYGCDGKWMFIQTLYVIFA